MPALDRRLATRSLECSLSCPETLAVCQRDGRKQLVSSDLSKERRVDEAKGWELPGAEILNHQLELILLNGAACKLALFWYRLGGPPVGGFRPYLVPCNVRNCSRKVCRFTCTLFCCIWPPTYLCKCVLIRQDCRAEPDLREAGTPASCCAFSVTLTVVTIGAIYLIDLWPILLQSGLPVRHSPPGPSRAPVSGPIQLH